MQYTYYGKGGEQTKSLYPKNNRPFNKTTPDGVLGSSFGKPNPIKHWRKQLLPYYESNSTQITLDMVNNPTVLNKTLTTSDLNCNNVVEQVIQLNTCDGINVDILFNGTTCTGGTNHIRRSGTTNYKKNYCSSTRQYLQKRCKTFEQNMMVGKPIDLQKNLFNTTISPNNDSKSKCVVYKINNPSFSTIDSVVSSNYVSKKRNEEINRNPYNPKKKLEQQCNNYC
jgi:hypothetical protein